VTARAVVKKLIEGLSMFPDDADEKTVQAAVVRTAATLGYNGFDYRLRLDA